MSTSPLTGQKMYSRFNGWLWTGAALTGRDSHTRAIGTVGALRPIDRQLKARQLLDLTKKHGRLDGERPTDVEDASQGGIGLPQFDEADKGPLVACFSGKRLLAHLLPQPMLPQQLTERCGRIKFRIVIASRCHISLWHRKYITRRL